MSLKKGFLPPLVVPTQISLADTIIHGSDCRYTYLAKFGCFVIKLLVCMIKLLPQTRFLLSTQLQFEFSNILLSSDVANNGV